MLVAHLSISADAYWHRYQGTSLLHTQLTASLSWSRWPLQILTPGLSRADREKAEGTLPCKNLPLEGAHMICLMLTSQTLVTKEGKLRNGVLAWLKPCAQLKLQL